MEELNDQDGSLDNLTEFGTTDTSGTSVVFADGRRRRLRGECLCCRYVLGRSRNPQPKRPKSRSARSDQRLHHAVQRLPCLQWGDRFGSDNNAINSQDIGDDANDVRIDKSGNLYMTGEIGGLSTFGTNTNTIVLGQNSNSEEAYVLEVSSTGTSKGGASGTGTGTSEADALAISSNGQIAVIGSIVSPVSLGSHQLGPNDLSFIGTLGTPTTPTPTPTPTPTRHRPPLQRRRRPPRRRRLPPRRRRGNRRRSPGARRT